MNLASSYNILKLSPGASLDEVKKAYRAMALSLHPDHNSSPQAHHQFQKVHEAYLRIKTHLESKAPARNAEATQAYARQAAQSAEASFRSWMPKREEDMRPPFNWRQKGPAKTAPNTASAENKTRHTASTAKKTDSARGPERFKSKDFSFRKRTGPKANAPFSFEHKKKPSESNPLFDWINTTKNAQAAKDKAESPNLHKSVPNPDTRKIFDGIYSELKSQPPKSGQASKATFNKINTPRPGGPARPGQVIKLETEADRRASLPGKAWNSVKSWLCAQMDEEQILYVPRDVLLPGAKLRLQIRQPWSGEMMGIELTVPLDYVAGKSLRLKNLGRRLGKFRGDLYVRLMAQ